MFVYDQEPIGLLAINVGAADWQGLERPSGTGEVPNRREDEGVRIQDPGLAFSYREMIGLHRYPEAADQAGSGPAASSADHHGGFRPGIEIVDMIEDMAAVTAKARAAAGRAQRLHLAPAEAEIESGLLGR